MDFQFNNKQELIGCINKLNVDYYKPVDKFFKLYEEYSRDDAILLLGLFRDAHDCIIRIMLKNDIIGRKDKINHYLEKYMKVLRTINIFEFSGLIKARKKDLSKINFLPFQKIKINMQINRIIKRIKKYNLRKFLDYNNNTIDGLLAVLNDFKEALKSVESLYREYRLAKQNDESAAELAFTLS